MGSSSRQQGDSKTPGSMGNTPGTNFGNANHSKAQVGQNDRSLGQQVRHHEQARKPDQNDSPRRQGGKQQRSR